MEREQPAPNNEIESVDSARRPNAKRIVAAVAIGLSALLVARHPGTAELAAELADTHLEKTVEEAFGSEPTPETPEYLEAKFGAKNGMFLDSKFGGFASIWSHSMALSALQTATLNPGSPAKERQDFKKSLEASDRYWKDDMDDRLPGYFPAPADMQIGGNQKRYVDDNLWMGLIFTQEYQNNDDKSRLEKSKQIFRLAMSQWDKTGGGIYWQEQAPGDPEHSRSIVSNAPAAILGAKLYKITGDTYYLDSSEAIMNWTKSNLLDKLVGIYSDNMRPDGSVEMMKWSYGQGVTARAIMELSDINPGRYPLSEAVNLINTSVALMDHGLLPGNPDFHAIFYKHALAIAAKYKDPNFTARIQRSLGIAINELSDTQPNDLLGVAGRVQLHMLKRLSPNQYHKL